jgi:hypothetical protein
LEKLQRKFQRQKAPEEVSKAKSSEIIDKFQLEKLENPPASF